MSNLEVGGLAGQVHTKGRAMHVLAVDDHQLFREGLRLLLGSMDDAIQLRMAATAEEGLALAGQMHFDVILLDWHMEGLSGMDAMRAFREKTPRSPVIVLSGNKDVQLMHNVLNVEDGGAAGFIPKESSPAALLQALRTIAGGGIYLPRMTSSSMSTERSVAPAPEVQLKELGEAFASLTQRQVDVFRSLLRGVPNKVIARDLGISDSTVKTHMSAIFRELNVNTRAEAVRLAWNNGVRIS